MRINDHSNKRINKRQSILLVSIISCLAVAGAVTLLLTRHNSTQIETINDDVAKVNVVKTSGDNTSTSSDSIDVSGPQKTPLQYEGENPNTAPSLVGWLTFTEVSDENLHIRNEISSYLSSGSCVLELSSGAKIVTRSTQIIPSASTSTCMGFDIPISELSPGEWSIKINISGDDKNGVITGEIKI